MQPLQNLKRNKITGNPAQLRAIEHGDGAACVIAGPGSGKTYVIIRRVIRLIEKGVNPGDILVITFTKAAAITMQQRFIKETDSMYPEVLFGTFHSCFYQILKENAPGNASPLTIMRETDKYSLLSHVLKCLQSDLRMRRKKGIPGKDGIIPEDIEYDAETIKIILSEISRIKNDGESPENCDKSVPLREHFKYIYDEYEMLMRNQNLIDFDDMVLMCHKLLKENAQIREKYRKRFKFILIDEYQDINRMQFEVVRLLSGDNGNLFVVGDDDQSIYGFRGSRPELMLGFKDFFPDAKQILLNVNYRCAREILDTSIKVIEDNKVRFKKEILSGNEYKGGIVKGLSFVDKNSQYEFIADKIKELSVSKYKLNDIAVIFRTNVEASAAATFLISKKIPCSYKEKITFFHEKKFMQTIIGYLDFACDGGKRSDFFKIMNQPVRYISRDCAPDPVIEERKVLSYYSAKGKYSMMSQVQKFFRDIAMVRKLRPKLAIHYVRNVIGLDKFVREKYSAGENTYKEYLEDADRLMEICRDFESYKELKEYLAEQNRIKTEMKDMVMQDKNGVRLMTMHASKGLEFSAVFIPDLNEGIVPSRKSTAEGNIEEERRMFYVAITRAKNELYLSYVKGDKNNPMRMSGFLRPVRDLFDDSNNIENLIKS